MTEEIINADSRVDAQIHNLAVALRPFSAAEECDFLTIVSAFDEKKNVYVIWQLDKVQVCEQHVADLMAKRMKMIEKHQQKRDRKCSRAKTGGTESPTM